MIARLAVVTLLITLTACGGAPKHHAASTATPTPSVNPTAAAVNRAVAAECSRFAVVSQEWRTATAGESQVAQLEVTITENGTTWNKELMRAGQPAKWPDVPVRGNQAAVISLKIAEANLALGNLGLDAAVGSSGAGRISNDWLGVINAFDSVERKCP